MNELKNEEISNQQLQLQQFNGIIINIGNPVPSLHILPFIFFLLLLLLICIKGDHGHHQQSAKLEDALIFIQSTSCSEFCQSGGYGDGLIIGTAPFCDGKCSRDCSKTHCAYGNLDWSDYGSGCWSGNKICCCGKSKENFSSPSMHAIANIFFTLQQKQ